MIRNGGEGAGVSAIPDQRRSRATAPIGQEHPKTDQRVNLAYSDAASQRYVSVTGNCELVRDRVKAKELWNPAYKAWFPKGIEDPNLILLRVLILEAEYWDAAQGHMVKLTGFSPQG